MRYRETLFQFTAKSDYSDCHPERPIFVTLNYRVVRAVCINASVR